MTKVNHVPCWRGRCSFWYKEENRPETSQYERFGMECYSLLLCLLAGLEQLRHCTSLQTLDVSGIGFNGSFLSTLTSLQSLTARDCTCKDRTGKGAGLLFGDCGEALAVLTNLTTLNIGKTTLPAGTPHLPRPEILLFGCS